MSEPHLDHPGETSWWASHGPLPVLGPCPHGSCPHLDTTCIADGPDWKHYTLNRCVMPDGCNGECRAWHDERSLPTTSWLHVESGRIAACSRIAT